MLKSTSLQILTILIFSIFLSGCVGYSNITKSYMVTDKSIRKMDSPKKGWKNIPIYEDNETILTPYKIVAKVTVTGNENSFDKKMIKLMKKEAGRYHADAIIFKQVSEVPRRSFNGVAATLNIISIFGGSYGEYLDLDMGGDYIAYEYMGYAIRFLEKK